MAMTTRDPGCVRSRTPPPKSGLQWSLNDAARESVSVSAPNVVAPTVSSTFAATKLAIPATQNAHAGAGASAIANAEQRARIGRSGADQFKPRTVARASSRGPNLLDRDVTDALAQTLDVDRSELFDDHDRPRQQLIGLNHDRSPTVRRSGCHARRFQLLSIDQWRPDPEVTGTSATRTTHFVALPAHRRSACGFHAMATSF